MKQLQSFESAERFIKENKIAFLYLSSHNCPVCTGLFSKVEELLKKYKKIACARVQVDEVEQVAGQFSVFTVPAIILFIDGKEKLREARFISISDLQHKIDRFYDFI